ncbi:UNVERIFIED_CONTAM: hypothetical protein Sindi_2877300 [Sesamum indicum]
MGGGAWPFLVGGAICLVNSVNERDLSLLTSYAEVCDALRCSGPHARYTDVFNESIALADRPGSLQLLVFNEEFLVSASHQLALTTSLPFVHTARRSYRLNGPVKCSDRGRRGRFAARDVARSEPAEGSLSKPAEADREHVANKIGARARGERPPSGPLPRRRARTRSTCGLTNPRRGTRQGKPNEASAARWPRPRGARAEGTSLECQNDSRQRISRLSASMKNVAKCDTWCELQNPVNHRVFERKLRPKPLGQGTSAWASRIASPPRPSRGGGHWPPVRTPRAVGPNAIPRRRSSRPVVVERSTRVLSCPRSASSARASRWTQRRQRLRPRPQVRRDHPLSLSISISGGKETYKDSPSNGERTGNSPNLRIGRLRCPNCSLEKRPQRRTGPKSPGKGRRRRG